MRFAVSLLNFRPGRIGGAETYVRQLLAHLPAAADGDELVAVLYRDAAAALPTPGFERVVVDAGDRAMVARRILEAFTPWRDRALERLFAGLRFDAALFPQQSIFPKRARARAVVTVHDLQHLRYPENFGLFDRSFRAAAYPRSLGRAERIIAISDATRRELVERCGVAPDRIVVIPHGFDGEMSPGAAPLPGLERPYLYYPAASYRHKGHDTLFRAFAALRRRGELPHRLVLSGERTAHWRRLERLAEELGISDEVVHLGFVPRAEVARIYAGADAVVFPSRYEGFGLPVLEAASLGCKVIASRLPVLEELGLPAEWRIDFAHPDELLGALRRPGPTVLDKRPPSWEECARATVNALRRVGQVEGDEASSRRAGGSAPCAGG